MNREKENKLQSQSTHTHTYCTFSSVPITNYIHCSGYRFDTAQLARSPVIDGIGGHQKWQQSWMRWFHAIKWCLVDFRPWTVDNGQTGSLDYRTIRGTNTVDTDRWQHQSRESLAQPQIANQSETSQLSSRTLLRITMIQIPHGNFKRWLSLGNFVIVNFVFGRRWGWIFGGFFVVRIQGKIGRTLGQRSRFVAMRLGGSWLLISAGHSIPLIFAGSNFIHFDWRSILTHFKLLINLASNKCFSVCGVFPVFFYTAAWMFFISFDTTVTHTCAPHIHSQYSHSTNTMQGVVHKWSKTKRKRLKTPIFSTQKATFRRFYVEYF